MKNLLIIALIILMSFSAGVATNIISRPAKPRSIYVETLDRYNVKKVSYNYFNQGYQIHSITAPNSSGSCILVMEKY